MAGPPPRAPAIVLKIRAWIMACSVLLAASLYAAPAWSVQHAFSADPAWVELHPVRATPAASGPEGARTCWSTTRSACWARSGVVPGWWNRCCTSVAWPRRAAVHRYQPLYQRVEIHAIEVLRDGELLDRRTRADIQVLRGIGHGVGHPRWPPDRAGHDPECAWVTASSTASASSATIRSSVATTRCLSTGYDVAVAERRIRFLHGPGPPGHEIERPHYGIERGTAKASSASSSSPPTCRAWRRGRHARLHESFGRLRVTTLADCRRSRHGPRRCIHGAWPTGRWRASLPTACSWIRPIRVAHSNARPPSSRRGALLRDRHGHHSHAPSPRRRRSSAASATARTNPPCSWHCSPRQHRSRAGPGPHRCRRGRARTPGKPAGLRPRRGARAHWWRRDLDRSHARSRARSAA